MNKLSLEEIETKMKAIEYKEHETKIKELEQKIKEIQFEMKSHLELMAADESNDVSALLQHAEQYVWFAFKLEPLLFKLQRIMKIQVVS